MTEKQMLIRRISSMLVDIDNDDNNQGLTTLTYLEAIESCCQAIMQRRTFKKLHACGHMHELPFNFHSELSKQQVLDILDNIQVT